MKVICPLIFLSLPLMAAFCWAADSQIVSVSAIVLSKSECKFNSNTASLGFGNLDPVNPVDRTVTTSLTFRCGGSNPNATFSITDDDGLHETGLDQNRMSHTSINTEYLSYHFTVNPSFGTVPKNTNQTVTISGTVKGPDYQNAAAGNYSDTVVISIEP